MILAGRRINDGMAQYVAQQTVKQLIKAGSPVKGAKVTVLGLTFKENCPDIRNSKVADLVRELEHWGVEVVVSDPWANPEEVRHEYGITLGTIDPAHPVDSLVVAVGHQEFRTMDLAAMRTLCRHDRPVLADIKALFDRHAAAELRFTVFRF